MAACVKASTPAVLLLVESVVGIDAVLALGHRVRLPVVHPVVRLEVVPRSYLQPRSIHLQNITGVIAEVEGRGRGRGHRRNHGWARDVARGKLRARLGAHLRHALALGRGSPGVLLAWWHR